MHHGPIGFQSPLCSLGAFTASPALGHKAPQEREAVAGTGIVLAVLVSAVLWMPPALALSYLF